MQKRTSTKFGESFPQNERPLQNRVMGSPDEERDIFRTRLLFYRFYYMRKVGLLFFALASCCASAFAGDAYYLIKDGKFQNGVTFAPFEDDEKTDNVIEEGDGYATIKHLGGFEKTLETRLSGMDFNIGGKTMVIEYMVDGMDIYNDENGINGGNTCEAISKPTIIIECFDEEGMSWLDKFSDATNSKEHLLSKISIDGKSEGCDTKWQTYREYAYPCKSNAQVKNILIAYKREVPKISESVLKIKNFYFENDYDNYPIYGCQFLGGNLYEEFQPLSGITDESITKLLYQDGLALRWDRTILPVDRKDAQLFISYEGELSDGSGVPASEVNATLVILSPASQYKEGYPYSIWFDTIPLPEEAAKEGKIKVECLAKHYGKEVSYTLVGNVDGINQDELLPIYISFDNSTEAVPAFKDSIINGTWTKEVGEIDVPAGAKSIFVEFRQNEKVSYLVDKFLITYKSKNGVATVNGDGTTLSIYPNPVLDEIAFYGIDEIQSVEVVSLNGAVKACKVVNNKVNVSSLAAGEYAIIVNKNITGKFIKK